VEEPVAEAMEVRVKEKEEQEGQVEEANGVPMKEMEVEEPVAEAMEVRVKEKEEQEGQVEEANDVPMKEKEELEGPVAEAMEVRVKEKEELEGLVEEANDVPLKEKEELEGQVEEAKETTVKETEELESHMVSREAADKDEWEGQVAEAKGPENCPHKHVPADVKLKNEDYSDYVIGDHLKMPPGTMLLDGKLPPVQPAAMIPANPAKLVVRSLTKVAAPTINANEEEDNNKQEKEEGAAEPATPSSKEALVKEKGNLDGHMIVLDEWMQDLLDVSCKEEEEGICINTVDRCSRKMPSLDSA